MLIIDEMGYLPFDEEGAHCLFQLNSRHYEKSSTILPQISHMVNGEIFNDNVIAAAILDRILHHCTTINIKGESYWIKERKKQGIKTGNLYQ